MHKHMLLLIKPNEFNNVSISGGKKLFIFFQQIHDVQWHQIFLKTLVVTKSWLLEGLQ